jgi:hypothetical protein
MKWQLLTQPESVEKNDAETRGETERRRSGEKEAIISVSPFPRVALSVGFRSELR